MHLESPIYGQILRHLLTVGGFLLAIFLVARLMSEKKQPGNTLAWLLGIVLVPYVGVPLYLLFGGRKLQRLVARKSRLAPVPSRETALHSAAAKGAVPHALVLGGACPPVGGNSVLLLTGGEQAYAELERHIREARTSIHIMTFILGRDEAGKEHRPELTKGSSEWTEVKETLTAPETAGAHTAGAASP